MDVSPERAEEIRAEMQQFLAERQIPDLILWTTADEPATAHQIGYIRTYAAQHEDMAVWESCEKWKKGEASAFIQKIRDERLLPEVVLEDPVKVES